MYTLLRKLKSQAGCLWGWAFFYDDVFDPILGRTTRLSAGGSNIAFCFIPLIDMTRFQRIRPFAVGVSVAALFQIHVFLVFYWF